MSYSHLYSRKELERNNYELFYLKNYYENIINSMPVPLLLINSEMNILFINRSFCEGHGVSKEKYVGGCAAAIFRPGTSEYEYFSGDAAVGDNELMRFLNVDLAVDDSSGAVNMFKIPIHDEDESFLGYLLYFDAISMNVDLEQYNNNIQAMKRVPFFAHQIRNPLAILSNFLTLIKEKVSSEEIREYLGRSEKEIKRINLIVSNLMKEQDSLPKQAKTAGTRVWLLAEEIRLLFMPMIGDRPTKVVNHTQTDLHVAYDEDELKEVLINLVLNAIEAITTDGLVDISSSIESLDSKRWVVIRVKDNGEGMESEIVSHIFEPFFSMKSGKDRRGLGLSICKDIINTWGGKITVDSTPGVGSIFTIYLPA